MGPFNGKGEGPQSHRNNLLPVTTISSLSPLLSISTLHTISTLHDECKAMVFVLLICVSCLVVCDNLRHALTMRRLYSFLIQKQMKVLWFSCGTMSPSLDQAADESPKFVRQCQSRLIVLDMIVMLSLRGIICQAKSPLEWLLIGSQ